LLFRAARLLLASVETSRWIEDVFRSLRAILFTPLMVGVTCGGRLRTSLHNLSKSLCNQYDRRSSCGAVPDGLLACSDGMTPGSPERIERIGAMGDIFYVVVDGYDGKSFGAFRLTATLK
jgi:hypothetical protein